MTPVVRLILVLLYVVVVAVIGAEMKLSAFPRYFIMGAAGVLAGSWLVRRGRRKNFDV